MTRRIAIIGTAGRDKSRPMDSTLWRRMLNDVRGRIELDDALVSGGAAWADHLAVRMYLDGWADRLVLHLPAPFDLELRAFKEMGRGSAGSAANYYHQRFSFTLGERQRKVDSLAEIAEAIRLGAVVTEQRLCPGYGGMHARNKLVALDAEEVVAYTWGHDSPADGGTLSTWLQCGGKRTHVSLHDLRGGE